jgi:hypothetical protein
MAQIRSQFVSSVSHELKTPLTAIRMFAETLRLGRSKNPAAQAEYLDTIVNESARLTRLLNNVLDFENRVGRGSSGSAFPRSSAAVRAMEYPSATGFELDVRTMRACRRSASTETPSTGRAEPSQQRDEVLGESRTIGLGVHREGDFAVIKVTDKGVGIEPKDQDRIFEKFYRVPAPEGRSLPGTGLGLSLVAHIAKAHRGSVKVESAPGKGSTFSIILPLENEPWRFLRTFWPSQERNNLELSYGPDRRGRRCVTPFEGEADLVILDLCCQMNARARRRRKKASPRPS